MKKTRQITAIIEREGDGYVALCPELDIASQGETVESARRNLIEAVELFLETADPSEVQRRCTRKSSLPALRLHLGRLRALSGREVCQILACNGFTEVRRRGSHVIMQKRASGSTVTVPVPDHREIRLGTLQSIIRQSQLPRSEFESR